MRIIKTNTPQNDPNTHLKNSWHIKLGYSLFLIFSFIFISGCNNLESIEETEAYAANTYWSGKIQNISISNKNDYIYAFKLFGDKTACMFVETPITGIVRADGNWSVSSVGKITVHFNSVGEYPERNYTIDLIKDSENFTYNDIKYEKMEKPAQEYLLKTCPDMSR